MRCGLPLVLTVLLCAASALGCSSDETTAEDSCLTARTEQGEQLTIDIQHDGLARSYLLYVPQSLDPKGPSPLVLNYHGLTSTAAAQSSYTSMNAFAEDKGFVVAYPEGINKSHNGGSCCGQMAGNDADDLGFARAVVADVGARVCVDGKRVYSTGMSNGGYMSEYNACHNADLFAAVAPVSALGFMQHDCPPSRPIALLAFNGTTDPLVNYGSAVNSVAKWVERNGCADSPSRTDYGASYCETWGDCTAGSTVSHCTITGMDHCWPGVPLTIGGMCDSGGLDDIHANTMLWDFFASYPMP